MNKENIKIVSESLLAYIKSCFLIIRDSTIELFHKLRELSISHKEKLISSLKAEDDSEDPLHLANSLKTTIDNISKQRYYLYNHIFKSHVSKEISDYFKECRLLNNLDIHIYHLRKLAEGKSCVTIEVNEKAYRLHIMLITLNKDLTDSNDLGNFKKLSSVLMQLVGLQPDEYESISMREKMLRLMQTSETLAVLLHRACNSEKHKYTLYNEAYSLEVISDTISQLKKIIYAYLGSGMDIAERTPNTFNQLYVRLTMLKEIIEYPDESSSGIYNPEVGYCDLCVNINNNIHEGLA